MHLITRGIKRVAVTVLLSSAISFGQSVKRGRNEGTFNIPASNVMGNGNLTISGNLQGGYSGTGFRIDPGLSLGAGIAEIFQLCGKVAFTNFKSLGSLEAHVQLTTPGNDHLRFFGLSLSGDLYLSTEMDTITGVAASGKPEYNSYIRPSLIADLDWIAKFRRVPLKQYFLFSMADNPDLLYLYEQLSIKTGLEWKMYQHSFFCDVGLGLYKEKSNKQRRMPGDPGYVQQSLWVEPGFRYRVLGRYSILSALKVLIFQRVKETRPLVPNYVRLTVAFEAPLFFRETNTEAIRTLLFVEQEKEQKKDLITKTIEQGKKLKTDFEITFEDLSHDLIKDQDDRESIQKREEIQKRMEEIEQLLEALE